MSGYRLAALIAVCLARASFAAASAPPPHPLANENGDLPIPADLQKKVALSESLGFQLYLLDKAAALGTDVLREHLPPSGSGPAGGYLVVRDGDEEGEPLPSFHVLFYTAGESPAIKYRVQVFMERGKKSTFESVNPPVRVDEHALPLVRARAAALRAAGPFAQPINPVVLPADSLSEESGAILVELLAGTTKPKTVVLGKHFRVIVSPDGRRVLSVMPLSNAPIEIQTSADAAVFGITHFVTDYPVETHVLASLQQRLPVYVMTARGMWQVLAGKISLKAPPKDDPPR